MPNTDTELISTRQAADLLGENVRKTIRRVERGQLTPAKKLEGLRGAYLFDQSVIESLAARNTAAA